MINLMPCVFHSLKEILEFLLSTFESTEMWVNISSALPYIETIMGTLVNIEQAENGENNTKQ